MRATDRLWIAVTFAGGVSALTLLPLTQDASYLAPSWVVLVVVASVAIAAERLRVSKAIATLVQMVLGLAMFVMLAAGFGRQDLPWWRRLLPLLHDGYDHIRVTVAPMPGNEGVQLIFVMLIVLLSLTAGILADVLERPSYTLAPLLTLYLVPAIALRTDVNPVSFLAVVVGYLAVLFADGLNAERSWTRSISSDSAERRRAGGVWRVAGMVAAPALVVSVVLGMLLPTLPTTYIESLRPNGTGPIEMVDPQVDLRRNLEQPVNREVLTYTTSRPDGVYLRQTTLPQITSAGWVQTQVSLRQGTIGSVPGVSGSHSSRQTQVQISDFRSMYLPVPYAPRAQSAPGEWSWDPVSLMVIATGPNRNQATEGLRYNVESWDITPDGAALSQALVSPPEGAQVTMEVPADIPPAVTELATKVTAGYDQPALKAAAIQAYLRSGEFRYDVQSSGGETTLQAMESFLTRTKTGYCVHFAGSMALMARVVGIPSRVAVGFLPGQQRDGRWVVTAHDMHAWPELYFEGFGWVRFEPTPSVTATPPPWTVLAPNQPSEAPSEVAPSPGEVAPPSPGEPSSREPSGAEPPQTPQSTAPQPTSWLAVAGTVTGLGLLVALALTPMLVRLLRRRSRLSGAGEPRLAVSRAWDEVRDTWVDLGRSWPHGSPRQVGAVVAKELSDAPARDALRQVVTAVEQSRYSRSFTSAPVGEPAAVLVKGMSSTVSWDTALLARFLPRSLREELRQWYVRRRARLRSRIRQVRRPSTTPRAATAPRDDSAFQRPVGAGRR